MGDEFTIQKNSYVEEEKKKITENYKNELANQEVRLKIEKSKQQNIERIQKMRKVNEYVEDLKKEMRAQIRAKMNGDQAAYKELLKNLLIQVSLILPHTIFVGAYQADGGPSFYQVQRGRCRTY